MSELADNVGINIDYRDNFDVHDVNYGHKIQVDLGTEFYLVFDDQDKLEQLRDAITEYIGDGEQPK